MIQPMFVIYDQAAEYFCPPFTSRSKGEAIRDFADTASQPGNQINKSPADFTLFEIGTYNNSDASFKVFESKVSHGTALELRTRINNQHLERQAQG